MEVVRGYKQTELGNIPEDWRIVSLSETAKRITRGASPRPIDSPIWFDSRSSVGWVRISDVTRSGRFLTDTTQRLSAAGIRNSRPVPSGSLIMSICATVGRPIETRIDSCIHDGFVVFDQPTVDQSFLYHELTALEPTWSVHGQTGSQMNLNTGLINARLIPLPPTEAEQRAIATALSDVDTLLDALDQLLEKKRDLKQVAMQKLLTGQSRLPGFKGKWELKRLSDLGAWKGGMTPSMQNPDYWRDGTIPWVSSGDIKSKVLTRTGYAVTPLAVSQGATSMVPAESLLVVARSGILRRYLPVTMTVFPVAINQDVKALIPNEDVNAQFLLQALTANGDRILKECMKTGTTVESIDLGWLKSFTIFVPRTDEQEAIAVVLSDMDAEIDALEARRAKTRDLKQAMMQELLTGRIRLV